MGFDLPVMNRLRRSGRALSPASLFATGAQGVIYDPRDLSTMFQDSLGTTPVTAPGQSVGLRLDKSKGGPGPDLVTNGTFDTNIDGWSGTANLASSSVTAGIVRLTCDFVGGAAGITQALPLTVGKTYLITGDIRTASVAPVRLSVVNNAFTATIANGTDITSFSFVPVSLIFTATETNNRVYLRVGATNGIGEFDNIVVREIPGNHAIQTTAGARLTYGIEPKTGTRNLLIQTEGFNEAAWTKQATTVSANSLLSPVGTLDADKLVATAAVSSQQKAVLLAAAVATGTTYTASCYAKAAEYSGLYIRDGFSGLNVVFNLTTGVVASTTGATGTITPVGDGWFRCTATMTTAAAFFRVDLGVLQNGTQTPSTVYTGDGTSGIHIWGAQLELGAVATPYQKVVTAFEVTEAGVPTCHYCAYAGANSMATAAIDFTATDKMSIFVGVRDAAPTTVHQNIVELSTGAGDGRFLLHRGLDTSTRNLFQSRGTLSSSAGNATPASPTTLVLTGLGDISGDIATLRVNGTQVAQSTADQGTGNYGNHILYIGRRANSTLPLTGRDYGIVIVGKATSAAEINITEAWLAANTPTVVL